MRSSRPTKPKGACGERILDAAERVVAQNGVRSMTLEAVARAAGVSKGGLLYHFPSKATLIHALIERMTAWCESSQRQAMEKDPAQPGAFTRAYMAARTAMFDDAKAPSYVALLIGASSYPKCLSAFTKRLVHWHRRLERDGLDPVTASVIHLAADGFCLARMLGLPVLQGDLYEDTMQQLVLMTRPANQKAINLPTGGQG